MPPGSGPNDAGSGAGPVQGQPVGHSVRRGVVDHHDRPDWLDQKPVQRDPVVIQPVMRDEDGGKGQIGMGPRHGSQFLGLPDC